MQVDMFGIESGKQCPWIAIRLQALLVEGIPQAPMNAEFHSAAARPMDAFDHDQRTAGRGFSICADLEITQNRNGMRPAKRNPWLTNYSLIDDIWSSLF